MANKYAGEWPLKLADKEYTLCFHWGRIAELQSVLGDDAPAQVIKSEYKSINEAASVLAIGLKDYHPDLDEAAIMKMSPPLVPVAAAMKQAMLLALFGPTLEPEEAKAKKPPAKDAKKKTSSKKR